MPAWHAACKSFRVPLGCPQADGSQARRQQPLHATVLLLATVAVYAPVIGNDFVFDDVDFLQHGETIHHVSGVWRGFVEPYWEIAGVEAAQPYYRPLGVTAFTLLWLLGDGRPWAFHAASLLLHLAGGLVLMRLALGFGLRPAVALAAGLLFALHPAQVQAVAWSTCLTELASTVCVLAALLAWQRRRASWCGVWSFAGMACKETAVAGVLILAAAECVAQARPASRRMLGALAGACACYGMLRLHAVGWDAAIPAFVPAETIGGLDARARAVDLLAWLGHQTRRLVSPWSAAPFPDPIEPTRWSHPRFAISVVTGLLVLVLLAIGAARAHWSRQGAGVLLVGLLLVVFAQLPALLTGDRARPPLADRFLNLPLAGCALLCAAGIQRLGRSGLVCALALAALAAGQSVSTLAHWKHDEALFTWAVRSEPRQALPWSGYAQCLLAAAQRFPEGDPERIRRAEQAIKALERGAGLLRDRPLTPRIADDQLRSALGHAWFVQGDFGRAERLYREVLADHPGSLGARLGLACVLGTRGEHASARGDRRGARRSLLEARALFASLEGVVPHSLTAVQHGSSRVEDLLAAVE